MYEPPKSKQLPENPYAGVAAAHNDVTHAVLALAWEISRVRKIMDPYDEGEA